MPKPFRKAIAVAHLVAAAMSIPFAQTLEDSVLVAMVPAGFPVGFDLLTQGQRQYVAYYDSNHDMTVASRTLGSTSWTRKVLPSRVGWDTHNYVTFAQDALGHLHVSGNMHNNPLVYFRASAPHDVLSLARVPNMVLASKESSVTYPEFVKNAAGDLYFFYRQGGSGDGAWYFNRYHPAARTWSALYNGSSLFGNLNSVNAYSTGPRKGPDGRFHVSFMWRDTPDAATCHDIAYIRTRGNGLEAWETVSGAALALPVTVASTSTIVDPVAVRKGLINMSNQLGFDTQGRAIISYHKYDAAGISQVYNARWSETERRWVVTQTSAWRDYKWAFGGGGSIPSEIDVGPVEVKAGKLVQTWRHIRLGTGQWTLDEATLKPIPALSPTAKTTSGGGQAPVSAQSAAEPVERLSWDRGAGDDPAVRYALRWKTLPPNRDVRPPVIPPDSRLEVLKYRIAPVSLAPESPRAAASRKAGAGTGIAGGSRPAFTAILPGGEDGQPPRSFDGRGRVLPDRDRARSP